LNYEQRLALVRQVARRLEKLDDDRLADLESRTRAGAAPAAPALSRRNFLRDVLLYTGAGLAVGGAAAYAKDRWEAGQAPGQAAARAAEVVVDGLQAEAEDSAAQVRLLQQSLAAAEAALEEVRPQLTAALTENAGLKNDLTAAQSSLLETRQEADGLRGRLAEIEAQIAKYRHLINLFESLESVPLESAVVNGLAAAAISFGSVLGLAPLVAQGLAAARSLLDAFETQFPAFRAGLDWLKERLDGLENGIAAVEAAAERALDAADPVASRLAQLIDYILDHLPFGIGRSIKAALVALNDLYHSLPELILGANGQVVDVLSERFGDGKAGLSKALLQPVRESALQPAGQLAAEVENLHQVFVRDLHDPLVGALDRRSAIRKEIEAYRAANPM
jgi:hypothetical protein